MIKLPGKSTKIRLFDRVETKDDQYDIFDVGLQYEDGGIDSVVVGGSFYTLKRLARQAEEEAALDRKIKVAEAQCISKDMVAELATPAVQGVVKHPVVNYDGAEQDIEGL